MAGRLLPWRRVTRNALALVASVSLVLNLSCAATPGLPPLEQPSAVELKSPAIIVVRNAAGETSYPDILTVYGVITTADETSLRLEVRELMDPNGIHVPNVVGGTATVNRGDVRRIFESESTSRRRLPPIALIAIPMFLAASALVLMFMYKAWTILF